MFKFRQKQAKRDIFRPRFEPSRTLYDALQAEAIKRKNREWPEWHEAELRAMHNAACDYATAHGLSAPTYQQVCEAEQQATGHTDYGAKWAYYIAALMSGEKQ